MTADIKLERDTQEYVKAEVTADVSLTMGVDISISRGGVYVWQPGTWLGSAGTTRTVRTTSLVNFTVANFPKGVYTVHVRLNDTEIPIIEVGRITIS